MLQNRLPSILPLLAGIVPPWLSTLLAKCNFAILQTQQPQVFTLKRENVIQELYNSEMDMGSGLFD